MKGILTYQRVILIGMALLFAITPLWTQEPADPQKNKTVDTKSEQTDTKNSSKKSKKQTLNRDIHRVRFILGFGKAKILPGVLSEAGPSWMLNSFLASGMNSGFNPVIPIKDPAKLDAWSWNTQLDYTWKDRLTGGFKGYGIDQKYGRGSPATVDFYHIPNDERRWSYFEGIRLNKYREVNKSIFIKYLHPVLFQGFKAGVYFSREFYDESNELSFGSYVATTGSASVHPGTTNWSQGGAAPADYTMKGFSIGPSFRYQLYDWLGLHYTLTPVSRSGSMSLTGIRLIQQTNDTTGATAYSLLIPFAFADVKDKGMRHDFEAIFRFMCRYTIHIGVLKEDFERSYGSYINKTIVLGDLPYHEKTPFILGLGEMNSAHKMSKLDIYMKFGTAIFF